MKYDKDERVVFTLDAGGTNYVFTAIKGCKKIGEQITLPSEGDNLDKSIANIKRGFSELAKASGAKPSAISFAFPGPADYQNGVIFNIGNVPAFAGGVALGDILSEEFGVPVFINNDGDLFVYGEAMGGALPFVNELMEKKGNPKRYKNLFGITLGTGLGGGFVIDGTLYTGDNSNAAEVWLMKNKFSPDSFAEEGACIRAVQKSYAKRIGLEDYKKYSPKDIEDIALGKMEGDADAAKAAREYMDQADKKKAELEEIKRQVSAFRVSLLEMYKKHLEAINHIPTFRVKEEKPQQAAPVQKAEPKAEPQPEPDPEPAQPAPEPVPEMVVQPLEAPQEPTLEDKVDYSQEQTGPMEEQDLSSVGIDLNAYSDIPESLKREKSSHFSNLEFGDNVDLEGLSRKKKK